MMDVVKKNWAWGMAVLAGIALFAGPFGQLFRLALKSSEHSHTILIPWVSLYLIWINRRAVFAQARPALAAGVALLAAGAVLRVLGTVLEGRLDANDFLVFTTAGGWLYLLGLFVGTSGSRAFRAALFPLLFAVLMVPLPTAVLNGFVRFLQVWSAEAAELIFSWAGIPFVREEMVFALTGISIEVAEQCSGIRSSLVLLIIGILVAYLFLKSGWRRIVFVLAVIPITIFKNGLRIAMLGYLGSYVDTAYVTNSALHHSGGYGFMVVALAMMVPVFFGLRWGEKKAGGGAIGDRR
jgi:exosortase